MKISLMELSIKNFKGIENKHLTFTDSCTIFGENGAGKTTVFDAFMWVLFGKDSKNHKDFSLKTLNTDGTVRDRLEHSVTATLNIDGTPLRLTTTLREKWSANKVEAVPTLKGNVTTYFLNDVPVKQEEYRQKISSIIDEEVFKIITSPEYFSAMPWQKSRSLLLAMTKQIDDRFLVGGNAELNNILDEINNSDIVDYKKQLLLRKKKLTDECSEIPSRIDEVTLTLPPSRDYTSLANSMSAKKSRLEDIELEILNNCKLNDNSQLYIASQLTSKLLELKNRVQNEYQQKREVLEYTLKNNRSKLANGKSAKYSLEKRLSTVNATISRLETEKRALAIALQNIIDDVYSTNKNLCPVCHREYSDEKKLEIRTAYEENKQTNICCIKNKQLENSSALSQNYADVEQISSEISALIADIKDLESVISDAETALANHKMDNLEDNPEYSLLSEKLHKLESEQPADNTQALELERSEITKDIAVLQALILQQGSAERAHARLKALRSREQQLNTEILAIDKKLYSLQELAILRMKALESSINSHFDIVKFKLYDKLINGNIIECLVATVDGVPYPDLNGAAKINCGIDIINSLCTHYNVTAPIFIDNRESITKLIPSSSQIIGLMVKPNCELYIG